MEKMKNGKKKSNSKEQTRNKNNITKDSLSDLLNQFNINKIAEQENINDDSSNLDMKYDQLKNQLKNSTSKNQKDFLLNEKKEAFSFSDKIIQKDQSRFEQKEKNIFLDESQNQSSMFQRKANLSKQLVDEIEQDSDLFEKDDDQSDDESTQMFSTKKTENIMCFDGPSKDDSDLDTSKSNKKDIIEKFKNSDQQSNFKEILLDDFQDGKIFSFSKEVN